CDQKMIPDYQAAAFKPGTIIVALPKVEPVPYNAPQASPPAEAPFPAPAPAPAPAPRVSLRPVAFEQVTLNGPPAENGALSPTPQPQFVFVSRDGNDGVKVRVFNETEYETTLTVLAGEGANQVMKEISAKRLVRHSETTPLPFSALKFSSP